MTRHHPGRDTDTVPTWEPIRPPVVRRMRPADQTTGRPRPARRSGGRPR